MALFQPSSRPRPTFGLHEGSGPAPSRPWTVPGPISCLRLLPKFSNPAPPSVSRARTTSPAPVSVFSPRLTGPQHRDPAAAPKLPLGYLQLLPSSPSATSGSSQAPPLGRLRLLPSSYGSSRAPPRPPLVAPKIHHLFSLLSTVHRQEAQRIHLPCMEAPSTDSLRPWRLQDHPPQPASSPVRRGSQHLVPSASDLLSCSASDLLPCSASDLIPSASYSLHLQQARLCLGLDPNPLGIGLIPLGLGPAPLLGLRSSPLGLGPAPLLGLRSSPLDLGFPLNIKWATSA